MIPSSRQEGPEGDSLLPHFVLSSPGLIQIPNIMTKKQDFNFNFNFNPKPQF
jgi:hypothetical protein